MTHKKRCAFLSMDTDAIEDFFVYDDMVFEPLAELGWEAEEISWRDQGVDWDAYDLVVVRSTWDYQQDVSAFLTCLRRIEDSRAILHNPLSTIEWNVNKRYLAELEAGGVPIVPSLWKPRADCEDILSAFDYFDVNVVIIKPQISANSDYTFRLSRDDVSNRQSELNAVFEDKPCVLQPFLESVVSEGEYSLFYFDGQLSHGILKRPKQNDFRVQEEHGGRLASVTPEPSLKEAADRVMDVLPGTPLYARVDLIRDGQQWLLMEVELIEPSLYFNMDKDSPKRFADAIHRRFG